MDKTNLIYKSISVILVCMILISSMLSVVTIIKDSNKIDETDNTIKVANTLKFESDFNKLSAGTILPVENNYVSEPNSEEETTEPVTEETVELVTEEETSTEEIIVEETTTEPVTEEQTTENIVVEEETTTKPVVHYNNEFTEEDVYHLAKIIMAEAEGSSQLCKEYVGQVVVNRYRYGNYGDSIYDVVFANNGKTYQFSPCKPGGRWYRVEPNQACYDAAYAVINAETPITDAWYFEDSKNPDNWHSRNLVKVATIDKMRFYRR